MERYRIQRVENAWGQESGKGQTGLVRRRTDCNDSHDARMMPPTV